MSDLNHYISMKSMSEWRVGYNPKQNLIFVYYVDSDHLIWAWSELGMNSCPFERLDLDAWIDLGEL